MQAVVLLEDLDPVGEPVGRDPLAGSAACSAEIVNPVTRQPVGARACNAKPPQPQPISSTWSRGGELQLIADRCSFARCASASDMPGSAKIPHEYVIVSSSISCEELVAEVVVVGDVPPRAQQPVAAVRSRPRLDHPTHEPVSCDCSLGVA